MARPIKQGLEYFPFDVDFFNDVKIRIIGAIHGNTALVVIPKLLCHIYRNGFYAKWGADEINIFATYDAFIPQKELEPIVDEALKRELFSEEMYVNYCILTSTGIQKRYFTACKSRKKVHVDERYLLINPMDYGISIEVNSGLTPINSEFIPQSRENENISNENREGMTNTLNEFYSKEVSSITEDPNPVSNAYKKLVSYILGENELKTPLVGLNAFHNQLSFEQFRQLRDNKCGNIAKYIDAVLKIHSNPQYQKGKDLFTRLSSWFDADKNPDSLQPHVKPQKVYKS